MSPVDVDPQAYFRSSSSARFAGQTADGALATLSSGLGGFGGMAGSDNTGQEFSGGYDQSANDIAASIAGLTDMSINAADLIRASGLNHQAAQKASTEGGPPPPSVSVPSNPATSVPPMPSAYGGGGSEPSGAIATAWYYIQQWVGYVWPNGDPAKLEAAAQVWTNAGNTIRNAGTPIDDAKTGLSTQQSPEISAATDYLTDLRGKYDSLSGACMNMATSCNDLAQAIKDAHQQLIDELAQFAAEFVVGEVIFAVLFEVGGEIWGNAAMAARAVIVAQRCARIIERLIELSRAAARVARAAADVIKNIVTKIRSVVAAIVKRSNTDRNLDALLKYTQQALDDFDRGIIKLTPDQANDVARYNAHKGTVLDMRVKELVEADPALQDLVTTGQFKYGPDFVNSAPRAGEAPWYDLTTTGGWEAKLAKLKYENTHGGPGAGIIWNAPGGPSAVPPR